MPIPEPIKDVKKACAKIDPMMWGYLSSVPDRNTKRILETLVVHFSKLDIKEE